MYTSEFPVCPFTLSYLSSCYPSIKGGILRLGFEANSLSLPTRTQAKNIYLVPSELMNAYLLLYELLTAKYTAYPHIPEMPPLIEG